MSRFKVVAGSTSGHCCFEASVVDSENRVTVCESFDLASARIIANALNAANEIVATWPQEIDREAAEREAARIENERAMERREAAAQAEATYWQSPEGQAELNGPVLSIRAAAAALARLGL